MSKARHPQWKRAIAVAAGAATVLTMVGAPVGAAPVNAEPASAPPVSVLDLRGPVAFTGEVQGMEDLSRSRFSVLVHPNEEVERALKVGDSLTLLRLPADRVIRTAGSQFAVVIDPASLPAQYVNDDGMVTASIEISDATKGVRVSTMASTRLVRGKSSRTWADPHDFAKGASLGRVTASSTSVQAADSVSTAEEVPEEDEDAADDWDGRFPLPVVSNPCPKGGCPTEYDIQQTLVQTSERWVTIGTTYPTGTNDANMVFTSSSTTTVGVAANFGSGWKASGSKSVSSGFSHTWSYSTSQRGYRVGVLYGKYRSPVYCDDPNLPPGGSVKLCGYEYYWKPMYPTGGTQTYTSTRPDWTTCTSVSSGTWTRYRTDGTSYSLSTGVKIKSLIGFDLSVTRGYSTSHKINYRISGSAKKMCGNGGKYPAVSGKQMEKTA